MQRLQIRPITAPKRQPSLASSTSQATSRTLSYRASSLRLQLQLPAMLIVLIFISTFSGNFSFADAKDSPAGKGSILDSAKNLIPDWVSQLFSTSEPATRPDGIMPSSHTLAANHIKRVLLKTILATYGQPDGERLRAFREIEAHLSKFATQPQTILMINTLPEYEALKASEIPQFWDLNDELNYWRNSVPPYRVVSTQNFEVQEEIQRDLEADWRSQIPFDLGSTSRLETVYLRAVRQSEKMASILSLIPDSARLDAAHQLDKVIAMGIRKIDTVGAQIAKNDNIKLPSVVWQRFFELILNQYFSMLAPSVKLNMLSQLIDLGPQANDLSRFEIVVLNAGPQFQKLFQIYARQDGFSSSLRDVFIKLEQATKAIPFRLIKPIIASTPVPFRWIDINPKPIGVGTMAQVHIATIEQQGVQRKVVVRLLKPNVMQRVQQDNAALASLARVIDNDPELRSSNFPLITPFVEQIQEMSMREAQMDITIANQNKGAKIYNSMENFVAGNFSGTLEFHVPTIVELPKGSPIMIQEYIPGTSFETFALKDPELARAAVESLAKKWLAETVLGSGFFHADLHQGNLRVNQVENKLTVNLLDFGMTGQLSEDMQNKFVLYGLAASVQDPALMAKMLYELSDKASNQLSQAQLQRLFEVEMARQKAEGIQNWPSYEWATLAVNAGMRFSIDFSTLNRGVVLLLRMLEDNHSTLDLTSTMKSIFLRNPMRLARLLKTQTYLTRDDWQKVGLMGLEKAQAQTSRATGDKAVSAMGGSTLKGVTNPAALMCQDIFGRN